MEFTTTGMLNEGKQKYNQGPFVALWGLGLYMVADGRVDGIHVDMDRLKKGEVK